MRVHDHSMLGAVLLAVPLLAPRTAAQGTPDVPLHAPHCVSEPAAGTPTALALDLARKALARGDAAAARSALAAVLARHPFAKDVLRFAIDAAQVPDERARALAAWLAAAADESGAVKLDPKTRSALGAELEGALLLHQAKVAAVRELVAFANACKPGPKELGTVIVLDLAVELCDELTQPMPKLRVRVRKDLLAARERMTETPLPMLRELQAVVKALLQPPRKADQGATSKPASTGGDVAESALAAARLLVGLCKQAQSSDLQGTRPDLSPEFAATGRDGVEKAREVLLARAEGPFTIEQLTAMDHEQRVAFTARHRSWANPALALSASGKYVVETTCGHATLLGAAKTVELHHERLVQWNEGKDPFGERRGRIRIVPEPAELEAEGAPYWWAGGFQAGDLTNVIARWASLEDLGRVLTHELCHRFDGTLSPFLPTWAVEGRGVHAGAAWGAAEEPRFQDRHLVVDALSEAYVLGYAGREKLEKLLCGTNPEYRDHYTAGYALWTYLATWPAGNGDEGPLYAEALERWLTTLRGAGKDPVAHFAKYFADGQAGRPSGMDAFAEAFGRFLQGGYDHAFQRKVEWMERYRISPGRQLAPIVAEEPNYSWGKERVEPRFGEEHALAAGRLLAALGRASSAVSALLFARDVDGLPPDAERMLAGLLANLGKELPARVLLARTGEAGDVIARAFPASAALVTVLRKERERLQRAAPAFAATLDATAAELARRLGMPGSGAGAAAALAPASAGAESLGAFGWAEEGLVGYERRRVAGLWFESSEGDLHVGREKPRDETGLLDREAHQRDAFVKGRMSYEGEYVFRTRVHLTSSYVSGALVLGAERRDRGVRITFHAGDFLYSVGKKEEGDKIRQVRVGAEGIWVRERFLTGVRAEETHRFGKETASFELEAHVRGPSVSVRIDGVPVVAFATPDASPIRGPIGWAMSQGAVRLQTPTVERIVAGDREGRGLDLLGSRGEGVRASLHRRVLGLPTRPEGQVLLFVPAAYTKRAQLEASELQRMLTPLLEAFAKDGEVRAGLVVAVPAALDATLGAVAREALAPLGSRAVVLKHELAAPAEEEPSLAFVDGLGFLRAVLLVEPGMGLFGRVGTWARRWRPR